MTAHVVAPLIGLALLATMTTACSATTTSASTAPVTAEGSALARESTEALAKGELIGTGVGAAAGAIYVVKKRSPR